ncbi:hypothetical protein EFP20_30210 (plasmid) [Burkholderia glumae]|nr:hypothetical protein EFP20_30210 [Burkholderia glumae]
MCDPIAISLDLLHISARLAIDLVFEQIEDILEPPIFDSIVELLRKQTKISLGLTAIDTLFGELNTLYDDPLERSEQCQYRKIRHLIFSAFQCLIGLRAGVADKASVSAEPRFLFGRKPIVGGFQNTPCDL